ncbi:MAG: hypothetical protein KDD22_02350 [Bdellovibrionales bacterium]|nr:hypothetical protein [Bdellovibrionales bacterium]
MSLKLPVVYIRGLNTSGSNLLILGWIPLPTSMYRPWLQFFAAQGVRAYAIDNLGGGQLREQIQKAEQYLEGIRPHLEQGFHLVAHSAGGLVGWGLASNTPWGKKIKSLTTLATPHKGSHLARVFLNSIENGDGRIQVLSKIGYDHERRIPIFTEFLSENVAEFKKNNVFPKDIPLFSCAFSLPLEEMSWPIRWTHRMGFSIPDQKHDGFIELESQKDGEVLGHWELDHSSQLGYHFYLNRKRKSEKVRLFEDLTAEILSHLKRVEG